MLRELGTFPVRAAGNPEVGRAERVNGNGDTGRSGPAGDTAAERGEEDSEGTALFPGHGDGVGGEATGNEKEAGGKADVIGEDGNATGEAGKACLLGLKPGLAVVEALFLLRSLPFVEYAEPNYRRRFLHAPDDSLFGRQWGFHNTGQVIGGTAETPDADIDAVEAWDLERGLSHRPVVAVIDTVVDLHHPDLEDKLWINGDEVPGNGLDDDGNGYVDDRNGYNWAGISHLYQNDWAYRLGNDQDHQLFAQSLTGTGDYLTSVGVVVRAVGTPALPFTLSVRSSLSGPDLASAVVQPSEVSPYFGILVEKELSTRVRLVDGATYYLVFSTDQLDASNYYLLYMNYRDPAAPEEWHDLYQDGSGWRYFKSTGSWERGDFDFCFRTNPNFSPPTTTATAPTARGSWVRRPTTTPGWPVPVPGPGSWSSRRGSRAACSIPRSGWRPCATPRTTGPRW